MQPGQRAGADRVEWRDRREMSDGFKLHFSTESTEHHML